MEIIRISSEIIDTYEELSNINNALKFYQDSLSIIQNTFGIEHHMVSRHLYLLGQAYEKNGALNNSIKQYKKALKLADKCHNEIQNQLLKNRYYLSCLSKIVTKLTKLEQKIQQLTN